MDTQLLDAIRSIIKEEVQKIVREEIQIALKPIYARLDKLELRMDKLEAKFKAIEHRLKKQDDKLDSILEGWQIQGVHREELDDHEERITTIEHHIPVIT